MAATLQEARDQLVPALAETQRSYASEASLSRERRARLEALRARLAILTAPDGRPFADCAVQMFDYGEALDVRLQARTEEQLDAASPERARLRTSAVASLGFLQQSLAREVAGNPVLPRDLPERALAYFRQLAEMREQQNRAAEAQSPPARAPEASPASAAGA